MKNLYIFLVVNNDKMDASMDTSLVQLVKTLLYMKIKAFREGQDPIKHLA
jgi:hypothetical protein